MIRNLKALGLALMAVFALGAVVASGASAQQGFLTTDGPEVTLTGIETGKEANFLKAFGIKVECQGSSYTGHKYEVTPHVPVPNGATTATLTPHYKEVNAEGKMNCRAAGVFPATVDMNGCDYDIHIGETTKDEKGNPIPNVYGVTFDVTCPKDQKIELTIYTTEAEDPATPFCTVSVAEQKGLVGGDAVDTTNGHIDLTGTVKGIKLSRVNHGAHGLLCANASAENGEFALDVTVSGDDEVGDPTAIGISE